MLDSSTSNGQTPKCFYRFCNDMCLGSSFSRRKFSNVVTPSSLGIFKPCSNVGCIKSVRCVQERRILSTYFFPSRPNITSVRGPRSLGVFLSPLNNALSVIVILVRTLTDGPVILVKGQNKSPRFSSRMREKTTCRMHVSAE